MEKSNSLTSFFSRKVPNLVLRFIILMLGFACIAAGIAGSRSTNMGVACISAVPNVLSYIITDFTLGQITLAFNALFLFIEIALLRSRFNPVQLLQIVCTVPFAAMIDFFVPIAQLIPQPNYFVNWLVLIVSGAILAFGVFLEVKSCMVPLPGEGVSVSIAQAFDLPFSKCKVGFDTTNIILAAVISLVANGALIGVREGSVYLAISVGLIVKAFDKLIPNFESFCPTKGMFQFGSTLD